MIVYAFMSMWAFIGATVVAAWASIHEGRRLVDSFVRVGADILFALSLIGVSLTATVQIVYIVRIIA
jgi:hypothetical protein